MADRGDLINQLAASMGAGQFAQTKFEESRFDPETGTLYCNGMVISSDIADKAISHFETIKKKCDMTDAPQRQMAMIYQCAIESIKMVREPDVRAFLKERAENSKEEK